MARQVIKKANSPIDITIGGETVHICACGLTKNEPYCDEECKKTTDEVADVIYWYDENNNKIGAFESVEEMMGGEGGGCGGGCCGGGCHSDQDEKESAQD